MENLKIVVDEKGYRYPLATCLGRGGQGEVWRTEDGRHIVKILRCSGNPKTWERQIGFVRRLDLEGLPLARPKASLRAPDLGYVADFLEDMVSIKHLIKPTGSLSAWYLQGGGLRRRLRLLAHVGEALLSLHAKGLIYGDLSHTNVFISEPVSETEAWLIDLDNLRHEVDRANTVFTSGFGAPEIVQGKAGSSSFSDTWSFAVLVYQTLCLIHPFIGDDVADGEPEREEEALAGVLPWVGHSSDDRNRSSQGFPPELVLSGHLRDLCRRCFEDGLSDPRQRPGIATWVDRLHGAADQSICCPSCNATYLLNQPSCPWCDSASPPRYALRFHRWVHDAPDSIEKIVKQPPLPQLPLMEEELLLTRRLTHLESGLRGRQPVLSLIRRGLQLQAEPETEVWISTAEQPTPRPLLAGTRLRVGALDQSPILHFGPPGTDHRAAIFGGGR